MPVYKLFKSFVNASRGLKTMLFSQHHAWFYLIMTLAVLGSGLAFHISASKWCWAIIAVVTVWTAEALNTAFEFLCDVAAPEFHPSVERAKDVAAGAVLVCVIGAILIGLFVFGPPLLALLQQLLSR